MVREIRVQAVVEIFAEAVIVKGNRAAAIALAAVVIAVPASLQIQ